MSGLRFLGQQVTIELWDGSILVGKLVQQAPPGVTVQRSAPQHEFSFVPWHSIKVMNG